MKVLLKIILTNWINSLVIFIALFLASFFSALLIDNFSIIDAFIETGYSLLVYGMVCWMFFFISVGILDVILFSLKKQFQFITYKLAIEWLLISSPFIFWLIKYNQWVFFIAVLAFLIGQYLRKNYITKILTAANSKNRYK